MRILYLSQYFDPEPTNKGLAFAQELTRQGHEVEVLTGFPNYPGGNLYPGYHLRLMQREELGGIGIIRVPLFTSHDAGGLRRMMTYLSFALAATLIGPWAVRKPDVIYAHHGNATIGLPAWLIGKTRHVPFVLDIQDLWPDSVTSSGMLPSWLRGLVPALGAWCGFVYSRAARITVLSSGFKQILTTRGVPQEKVSVIRNWCDEAQIRQGPVSSEEERLLTGRFNVVMAGNMGKMQGLDVVLDAAKVLQVQEPRIQFVLVGSGVELPRLKEKAEALGLANVLFLPRRPVVEIGALLHMADALLVHLKDDPLFAITIPSRIQAYLAVGRPILCGLRGNGADLVEEAGAGLFFQPERFNSLVEAVMVLFQMSPEARVAMGERGCRFYEERLSLRVGTNAFIDIFAEVAVT